MIDAFRAAAKRYGDPDALAPRTPAIFREAQILIDARFPLDYLLDKISKWVPSRVRTHKRSLRATRFTSTRPRPLDLTFNQFAHELMTGMGRALSVEREQTPHGVEIVITSKVVVAEPGLLGEKYEREQALYESVLENALAEKAQRRAKRRRIRRASRMHRPTPNPT